MNLRCVPFDYSAHELQQKLPSALYTSSALKYQEKYHEFQKFTDISFSIYNKDTCIAFLLATISEVEGRKVISCFGLPVIFVSMESFTPEYETSVKNILKKFFISLGEASIIFSEFFSTKKLSLPAQLLLDNGANCENIFSLEIDLTLNEALLWKNIRSSYKSLIHAGNNKFIHKIYDKNSITTEIVEEFRQLHFEVAQRKTRSEASWMEQYEAIKKGNGFMQTMHCGDLLLSATHLFLSPTHCYYGVGVYRREYFDQPLAHAVLWNAVLFAQQQGRKVFEVGSCFFLFQNEITEKERSIVQFKRGFGGNIVHSLKIVK